MHVLSIGMDRKLFVDGSAVLERSKEYAKKMEELHIIVFSLKEHNLKFMKVDNLYIYPTNSSNKLLYFYNAYEVGKEIIENMRVKIGNLDNLTLTSQDPFETGLVTYFFSRKFNLPLQIQIHTDFLDSHFKTSFLNIIRQVIADFIIPKANRIRVVGENIKNSLIQRYRGIDEKIDVLPIYIDINELITTYPKRDIKKDFPEFNKIILMASRLTKEKRIDVALDSFEKVLLKIPNVGLVICGEGRELEVLKRNAKYSGISKNVVFLPWQEDMVSYYKTADVFLLTSEYEGYGMTLIEAGASGCPMVVTRVGVAKSGLFVDDRNSGVCPVGDTDCISGKIIELLENPTKRDLFKRKMQDSIKNISKTKEEYVSKYVYYLEKTLK